MSAIRDAVDAMIVAGVVKKDARAMGTATHALVQHLGGLHTLSAETRAAITDLNMTSMRIPGPIDWAAPPPGLGALVMAEWTLYETVGGAWSHDSEWPDQVTRQGATT